jgi:type I restriction enzyme S subunit
VSWKQEQLVEICEIFSDGDWIESKDQSDDGIRLIQTGNVGLGFFKARDAKSRYISEETYKKLRCTEIKEGDILVSRLPEPVGRSCILPKLDKKSITAVDCTIIRVNKSVIDSNFLNYYFQSPDYFFQVAKNVTGATRQRISRSSLGKINIPLPSLNKQYKLVAKLDAIFAEINKAVLATEANVKNAESLFQSYLREIFERGVEDWGTTTLDKVCRVDRGSSPRPIKNYFTEKEDGVNWIKIGDTEEGGKYIFSTNQKITKEGAEKSRYVSVGDFILTNSMSYGRPYIMRIDGYVHDGWFILRLNEKLDSEFFYYLLTSPFVQKQFKSLAAGAVVKNISGDLVKKTILPIPDLTTQKLLADSFTEKQKLLNHLSESYEKKIDELINLKNSILKKAFNGELIKD